MKSVRFQSDERDGADRLTRREALRWIAAAAAAKVPQLHAAESAASDARLDSRQLLEGMVSIDMHSHAGRVIGVKRVEQHASFEPVAAPMRDGGMAVLCLAIVSDAPTHHVTADKRIRPYRDPAPGELRAYGEKSFERLHALVRAQGLGIVRTALELDAARSSKPSVIVSAEGGDFLEGRPERLDDAYERWGLRHLQLTHYRVNALGDIQTEPPEHNGLTPVGADVLRRCNRLGIVADVAHGSYELVKKAADVTDKPLVVSHTSLAKVPGPHSRLISPDHARLIAGTGGVIGIWPVASIFPDLAAMAGGFARMADVVGAEHVGLGTDMLGLVGAATFSSYRDVPALADALRQRGFGIDEVRGILGGNYARVFRATVGEGAAAA